MRRKSSALLMMLVVVGAALGTTPGAIADSTASVDVAFSMANLFSFAQWLMLNCSLPAGTSLDTKEAKAKDSRRCRSVLTAALFRGKSTGCAKGSERECRLAASPECRGITGPECRPTADAATLQVNTEMLPIEVDHPGVERADKGAAKHEVPAQAANDERKAQATARAAEPTTRTPSQAGRPRDNAAFGPVSLNLCSSCRCLSWGGGYVSGGCYWVCSLVCLLTTGGNRYYNAACLIACRGACYVPRYCETYSCKTHRTCLTP